MNEAGLFPQQRGFCNGYDPQINPSIINEFAAAAFRWHSLVQVIQILNCEKHNNVLLLY